MPLIIPTAGAVKLLDELRPGLNAGGPQLALYQNDITPGPDTVFADFQPCNFEGYGGAQTLTFPDAAIPTADGAAVISAQPVVFTCTGPAVPQRVFGYFVYYNVGPTLLWAERLQQRLFMRNDGDFFAFSPTLNARSLY